MYISRYVRLPEGNNSQNYVTMGIYCDGLKWNDDSIDKEGPSGNIGPLGISGFPIMGVSLNGGFSHFTAQNDHF